MEARWSKKKLLKENNEIEPNWVTEETFKLTLHYWCHNIN